MAEADLNSVSVGKVSLHDSQSYSNTTCSSIISEGLPCEGPCVKIRDVSRVETWNLGSGVLGCSGCSLFSRSVKLE